MHEDSKESALALRLRQTNRYVSLALVSILALCALLFLYVGTIKQSESTAQSNQQVQAVAALDSSTCKAHPDQSMCVLAHQIISDPSKALPDPANTTTVSATGREVKTFTLNPEGNLVVTYTDGTSGTIGRVTGSDPITTTGTEALAASR